MFLQSWAHSRHQDALNHDGGHIILFLCCRVDIAGEIMLSGGGRPVHERMFSSIPGLYPLDASSNSNPLPVLTIQYLLAMPNVP